VTTQLQLINISNEKLSLGFVEFHIVKSYGGTWIYTHSLLTFAVDRDECLVLSYSRSTSGNNFRKAFIKRLAGIYSCCKYLEKL
jgi:hypothetical protein